MPFQAFFHGPERNQKEMHMFRLFSLVVQWLLFTCLNNKTGLVSILHLGRGECTRSVASRKGSLQTRWSQAETRDPIPLVKNGWIAAIGPPRKIPKQLQFSASFRSIRKNTWNYTKWGWEAFVLSNLDLANVLGRKNSDFENFYLFDFLDPTFLDFQVPRSPNSQISRSPDFQTPPPPVAPPDEPSDPNLTPLPTHPGIKYVARALAAMITC